MTGRTNAAALMPAKALVPDVLRVENLQTHFHVPKSHGWGYQTLRAVNGASFAIPRGTTLGLVGESGCGKSTLGRTILGLHEPAGGAVYLNGTNLVGLGGSKRRALRRHVQVVFQDPVASLDPHFSVADVIAEPLHINGGYHAEKVRDLLRQVGLAPEAASQKPSQFSGGQRQRIAIARALALQPDLIILDEAVSALDVSIQAQVLNLLKQLQRDAGVSYLFISHNLAVVRHLADQVAVMYLGRIVEIGTRDELFGAPRHPYTQALLSAVPVADPTARARRTRIILEGDLPNPLDPPSGCVFRTRCFKVRPDCSEVVPELRAVDGTADHFAACHYAGPLELSSTPSTP